MSFLKSAVARRSAKSKLAESQEPHAELPIFRLSYRALEPRMVFDAALVATVAAADSAPDTSDQPAADAPPAEAHVELIDALAAVPPAPQGEAIVFVDSRVQNYQGIIDQVAPGSQIVFINAESGGLEQIASYLEGHTNVSSIHILSHGASGQLLLGNDVLTDANLSLHTEALGQIGQSLSAGGDILIYGCDVAAGEVGQKFVDELAAATDADVAASTNLTGHAVYGADWTLEYQSGAIEAASLNPTEWQGTLVVLNMVVSANATQVTAATGPGITGLVMQYANVATLDGQQVNLKATVLQADANDTIAWAFAGGDAQLQINGGADGGNIRIRWEAVYAVGAAVIPLSDINIGIRDLDGPNLEGVAASVNGLNSYTVDSATRLTVSNPGTTIRADGTANESGAPPSMIRFGWLNVTSWEITYFTAPNVGTRFFDHDSNSSTAYTTPVTISSLVDLDSNNSSATGTGYKGTFTENGAGVPVVDTDMAITNLDGTVPTKTYTSATVVLTNPQLTDQLVVGGLPAGFSSTVVSSGGVITVTITGNGNSVEYANALKAVTFTNTSDTPITTDRSLSIRVFEGTVPTNTATSVIKVVPQNDAPVTAVPGAQTTNEDTARVFSAANGNLITISDIDAGAAGLETVTLSVARGTLTLGSTAGLTGLTGNGTGTVTFTGTVAQVNTAMAGLSYLNVADYNSTGPGTGGNDVLTINFKDDGKDSGVLASNGVQNATVKTVDITITAVADITNDTVTTTEDNAITFNAITGTLGATADSFENAGRAVTAVTNGTKGTVTFLANGAITYTPNPNANGSDSFTYTIASGGVSETATVTVNITAINDAPASNVPGAQTVLEDTALVFSAANFNAIDVSDLDAGATGLETVTLTVTNGSLNLGSIAGLTGVTGNGTSAVTFTGTVAQVTAAMSGLAYQGNANFNGSDTLSIAVTDDGKDVGNATSNGALSAAVKTIAITLTPVNDAPVTTVPPAQSVAEDTPLVFSGATAITIADVDAGGTGFETVSLTVAHGNLTLGSIVGLTGLSGNGTGTVTFTGTLAQINAAIAGLKYQGVANYNGLDLLTIQVTDDGKDNGVAASNGILSATIKTVAINVTAVNDPPVANTDAVSGTEDVPFTIPDSTLLGNDTDLDGDTLTIISVQGAANGTVVLDVNGNPVFTPNSNYFGPASFTYTISDGKGGSSTATANLTIAPVNDAPVAVNDSYATGEKTVLTGPLASSLLSNDTDVDTPHASLTLTQINGNAVSSGAPVTLASGAVLTPNANGTFSYNPNGAFNSLSAGALASDSFTYQVSDGQGGFATATATISITGVNDNPVANTDFGTTLPQVPVTVGVAAGVLGNDTDAENDTLFVSAVGGLAASVGNAVTGTNGGTFTINANGSYTFNPGNAFDGLTAGSSASTSITYTVSDGKGGTSSTTLTISVPYTNLPPVVQQPINTQNSSDGNVVSIPVAGVFADPNPGDSLTITASGLPPGLTYNPVTGAIEGTLTANASQHAGPYVVTLTADDGNGGTITSTFNFNVGNPPPVAVNDVSTVTEHGVTTGAVLTNDHDGLLDTDALSVTSINGAAFTPGSTITLPSGAHLVMSAAGTYSYDPNGAFNGLAIGQSATDNFSYQISDGQGGTAIATVNLTITGQNDTPIIVDPANPGSPLLNPNMIVPAQSGADGTSITPLNVTSFFKDPDNADNLTLSITGALPSGVTFNPATGTFSGTPSSSASQGGPANNGVYSVLVNANDGHGGIVSTTVTFTISNPAPIANNDSNTVLEHATTSGNVITNDADGSGDSDPLAVTLVNGSTLAPGATIALPSGALLVMNTNGTYSYNPNGAFASLQASQSTVDSFTYQISDGNGGFATATATIVIQGQNDNPVANADLGTTLPQQPVTVSAASGVLGNDTDAENDTLTVSAVGGVGANVGNAVAGSNGGTFTINANGSYTFDPGNAFDGLAPGSSASTSVTYTISDGHGGTSTTTLTISVPFTNLPPVVQQPIATQNSSDGNPVSIPLTGVFADPNPGDVLTITAIGLPPGLTYNPVTGAIVGTLAPNASQHAGPYIVTLKADDGNGGMITSTFNFNVGNPPPVAVNDTNSVTEHGTTAGAVLTNDHDGALDTDTLNVTQINGGAYTAGGTITLPSGALLVMNNNGTYSYDPNGKFNGLGIGQTATDTFSYQISDAQGGVATATVTMTINGQNEAPNIVDPANPGTTPINPNSVVPAQSGADGTAIIPLSVANFFKDPDTGDTLALTVAGTLPPGVVFVPATGTFTGTPTSGASQGGPANNGVYNLLVTASDGNGGTVSTTVTFTIFNPAPIANADNNTVLEHATTTGNVVANDADGGGDTDALTVAQVNGSTLTSGATITLPSGALLVMNTNGSYSYNPNGAFASLQVGQTVADSFTYQISDGNGGVSTATAMIVIQGQNDNPVANVDVKTVYPQTTISVVAPLGVLANDTDPEGDTLTVSAVNGVPANIGTPIAGTNGGVFTINADGSYTFNAGNDFDGLLPGTTVTTSVTYTVDDGHSGTSITTLTISVPFSNLSPVVNQLVPTQNSLDGNAISINVSNAFKDPNPGDVLTITATGLPPGLSYNPVTGAIQGTLSASASQHTGPYVVTLMAQDLSGNSVSTTFNFNVGNPPPVAVNDTATVTEHATLTGSALANDHDGNADTDPLTVTLVNGSAITSGSTISLPSGALLVMNANGTYGYNPNGRFDGLPLGQSASDSFTYQISDGQGGTSSATVSVTITGQNDAPVIVDPANPGTPADPNHVIPTQPANDGSAIAPLNVTSFFGDPDNGDTLTFSVPSASLPPGVTFDPVTRTFSGTPTANASQGGPASNGVYPVVITATDNNGKTVTTIVTFKITNPAPVATLDSNAVLEHAATTGNVLSNDRDGGSDTDPLTVTQVNDTAIASGGTITLPSGALLVMNANGAYAYNPNGAFPGLPLGQTATDTFTYQVSDGNGGFATASVTVVINGQNDTPFVVNPANPGTPPADPNHVIPTQTASDGAPITPVSVSQYFKDPDTGDTLTLSVPPGSLPPGVTFDPVTGTFSGTPTANASQGGPAANGVYPIVITATDSNGAIVTTIITIKITNPAPVAVNDALSINEKSPAVPGNVLLNDHDGGSDTDPLSVTKVNGVTLVSGATITLPSGALLVMNSNGTYSYDPNGVFNGLSVGKIGTDTFTYQVSDGNGGFATATVKISVTGQNDAPVIVNPKTGLPPSDPNHVVPKISGSDGAAITPLTVESYFNDPDTKDVLTFSVPAGSLPPGITFNPKTGTFSGTPAANASQGGPSGNGVYPIVVTASDGHGGTVSTIVTFSFSNPVPVAVNDKALGQPDSPVTIAVLNNDHDGGADTDHLTVVKATSPNGAVTMNKDGSLTFSPAPGFVGLATITYTISDGQGGTATATAVVLVTPNIHVTGPGAPNTPQQPLTSLPSNTGIAAEGAVLAAVDGANGLNSPGGGITVNSIIVSAANQVSGLGGIGGTRSGATIASTDSRDIHPLWRNGVATEHLGGRSVTAWHPEGMTGFSLRSTFAMETATGKEAQVIVESLVLERTLILRVFSTELADRAKVVDYRVTMADGRALPAWLDRVGPQLMMGEWPVNVEEIKLHITATLSDGLTIERDIVVQTQSGEIKPLELGKRSEAVPLFTEQLERFAKLNDNEFEKLLLALAG